MLGFRGGEGGTGVEPEIAVGLLESLTSKQLSRAQAQTLKTIMLYPSMKPIFWKTLSDLLCPSKDC